MGSTCNLAKWVTACGREWAGSGIGAASPRVGPLLRGHYVAVEGLVSASPHLSAASAVTLQLITWPQSWGVKRTGGSTLSSSLFAIASFGKKALGEEESCSV